jgi:hypothetical protein
MKTVVSIVAMLIGLSAGPALAEPAVDPSLLEWRKRVTEAKSLEDETRRRDAMLALLREALHPLEVTHSGLNYEDRVHPDDNVPAPTVNFDARLNQKTSARPRSGAPTRSLENNFGYYFSMGGVGYVVIGPAALDPRSPMLTRLAAEHELFHAMHHVGDPRPIDDRELETWSQMFVTFFHDVYQFRQRWGPMFAYYGKASDGERRAAIDRLVAYYRDPAAPSDGERTAVDVRMAFEEWLERRQTEKGTKTLINDLEGALAAAASQDQEWIPSDPL